MLHGFSKKTPESLVLLARAQFFLRNYSDCQETLKEIFAQKRDFLEAVALEAELCLYIGRFEAGIEKFESLSQKHPKNYDFLRLLALSHCGNGPYHRTITLCTPLMQAEPTQYKVFRHYEQRK